MKYIRPIYKLCDDILPTKLADFGFRKLFGGEIVYRFPVYKYNDKPLIYAEFTYDSEENQIHIRAIDNKGNSCNYNKEEYGKSKVIETINTEINKSLNKLKREGIIK